MKTRFGRFFFGALCLLASAGCHTDAYYQARAAEDAREYLLEHAPELTQEQVLYVRYNKPVFLKGNVLGDHDDPGGGWQSASSHVQQICAVWQIPGRDAFYMVCGFSEERMQFWSPNRLIRKKFYTEAPKQSGMLERAKRYAQTNLYHEFSISEFNKIRYTFPSLCQTDFEVNFNIGANDDPEAAEKLRTDAAKKTQYSIIWDFGDRKAVFTGYATETLGGWTILFAGVLPAGEVNSHTVATVKTPETFNIPVEGEEIEEEEKKEK